MYDPNNTGCNPDGCQLGCNGCALFILLLTVYAVISVTMEQGIHAWTWGG